MILTDFYVIKHDFENICIKEKMLSLFVLTFFCKCLPKEATCKKVSAELSGLIEVLQM